MGKQAFFNAQGLLCIPLPRVALAARGGPATCVETVRVGFYPPKDCNGNIGEIVGDWQISGVAAYFWRQLREDAADLEAAAARGVLVVPLPPAFAARGAVAEVTLSAAFWTAARRRLLGARLLPDVWPDIPQVIAELIADYDDTAVEGARRKMLRLGVAPPPPSACVPLAPPAQYSSRSWPVEREGIVSPFSSGPWPVGREGKESEKVEYHISAICPRNTPERQIYMTKLAFAFSDPGLASAGNPFGLVRHPFTMAHVIGHGCTLIKGPPQLFHVIDKLAWASRIPDVPIYTWTTGTTTGHSKMSAAFPGHYTNAIECLPTTIQLYLQVDLDFAKQCNKSSLVACIEWFEKPDVNGGRVQSS